MINQRQKKVCATAMLAGEILIQSNAEAYRVEDTVRHILSMSDMSDIHVIALTTGLYVNVSDDEELPVTFVRRIKDRSINLYKIARVNEISRGLVSKAIDIDEAYQDLKNMRTSEFSVLENSVASVLFIIFILVLFGGTTLDIAVVVPIAIVEIILMKFFSKQQMSLFVLDFSLSLIVAIMTSIFSQFLTFQTDLVIIASIMLLVPGTALTNGVRDVFRGDYTSGFAKLLEALMIALFISLGIGAGIVIGHEVLKWIF